jgi:hypothetical protein
MNSSEGISVRLTGVFEDEPLQHPKILELQNTRGEELVRAYRRMEHGILIIQRVPG